MSFNLLSLEKNVDGNDQTSLGQFSGRVQQTYKHSVPRFFVPEHGTMFTLALVCFQPNAAKRVHCVTGIQTFAFFFSSRRRHTRSLCDWSSDVCSSDLSRITTTLRSLTRTPTTLTTCTDVSSTVTESG